MPRRDGTGPSGFGPLTGRKMGNCVRGFGYGRGNGLYNQNYVNTKEELLKEKELLESRIKNIDKILEEK
jgi:hypothetical protein